ncbi:MAG: YkgJ family cysteine cluster protein [Candidatus Thermoplasmatota archaeon]|nr:YkgJ family cysteine cluster protein [Candidatus Thermoplasmatota archaeon]
MVHVKKSGFELHKRVNEEDLLKREWVPLEPGTRWECIRCSWCCRQPWAINITWSEYDRLRDDERAADLDIDRLEVDPTTGRTHPYFVIKGKCPLLEDRTNLCTLYPDWPYTCATYPFLLTPAGKLLVHTDCEGFGHGPIVDPGKMAEKIMRERERAGMVRKKG